ncbi:MAG TPA: acyl carrier protein [Bdellovibrionota bacterium]|nr:acyl carrier protein [Bdellovibrionota bacterium]
MSETTKKLIQLAAKKFHVDAKTLRADDDFFRKLAINSIQALELLSELEMEFQIEVPDYELQGVTTFGQLAAVIDRRR